MTEAVPESGSHMFTNSSATSVSNSTLTAVGGDANTASFDTAAGTIQAAVNNVGRDQNFYNVAATETKTTAQMRGTAVGIMISGKGSRVELTKDNKFTITSANPQGIIEDGESNTIILGDGNTFTLRQTGTPR